MPPATAPMSMTGLADPASDPARLAGEPVLVGGLLSVWVLAGVGVAVAATRHDFDHVVVLGDHHVQRSVIKHPLLRRRLMLVSSRGEGTS